MKVAKTGYIAISATLCIFGILLIVDPTFSVSAIKTFTGVALIAFGIIKIIGYFSRDLYRLAFQYDLAFGILVLPLGIIVLVRLENLMSFISVALGICVLADGLFKVQMSLDAKRFGITVWWLVLAAAIAAGSIGLVLIFRPGNSSEALTVLMGATLLADGILSIITVLTSVKIINHQRPDTE